MTFLHPGGGLDKLTAELGIFELPKKYFTTDRKLKTILSEKQNPKTYPPKSLHI